MNAILTFSVPDTGDTRCKTCKHHQYLVWSQTNDDVNVLHSHIDKVSGNSFPYIHTEEGIHWWGRGWNLFQVEPPECLKSYKKIGGK